MRSNCLVALAALSLAIGAEAAEIHVPADHATIQAAIEESLNGDTILVAPGTYREHIDFLNRNVALVSTDGPDVTILDGDLDEDGVGDGRVIYMVGLALTATRIEGFTIRNGWVDGTGGGAYVYLASPVIRGNRFLSNQAVKASDTAGLRHGGGLYIRRSGGLVEGNLFAENYAYDGGGGVLLYEFYGTVQKNIITDNTSNFGAGINLWSNLAGSSVPIVTNNLIYNNVYHTDPAPGARGGGVIALSFAGYLTNNVIYGNQSVNGGGIDVYSAATPPLVIRNNIIWGNSAATGPDINRATNADWYHNDIGTDSGQGIIGTDGNISADPLFADSANADFHILEGSPCIDAGEGTDEVPASDFEGDARLDDPATANTGAGTPDYVDIGADEYIVEVVLSPENLLCPVDGFDVTLGWTNPTTYDSILVRRDGEDLATLGGSDDTYLDADLLPATYQYEVIGVIGAEASLPAICSAAVELPPVQDLACAAEDLEVTLTWTDPYGEYDGFDILRDGELVATLEDGTAASYAESDVPPGTHVYSV
ncbi:MAG: right-handed parallel beta-helix repeat-containing protein, partial [Planctomycetes bacterium]|nr:right-handed parallel beta-helix repeat-containing protein [Planctomycetota bacterium]